MFTLPPLIPPKWTQDQAVSFEAARECLGEAIAIYIAAIDGENAKATPDQAALAELETKLAEALSKRRGLTLTDAEAIAEIRAKYGAITRRYSETSRIPSI